MKYQPWIGSILITATLLLAACSSPDSLAGLTPSAIDPASPTPTATIAPIPSSTPTVTRTPLPSSTSTITPVPCDLLTADYCLGTGNFVLHAPIASPGTDTIDPNYPYGSTEGGTREAHHGVEFENPSGTPVLAAANGTIYYAGDDTTREFSPWPGFYGNIIVIEHSLPGTSFDKLYTLYAHLSRIYVTRGEVVSTGDIIGEVGMTGTAAGSHLHFEVRVVPDDYFSTLDPVMWLVPHPGHGTLAILAIDPAGELVLPSDFSIQYSPGRNQPPVAAFTANSYATETMNPEYPWNEIATLGDRPAGWYRITYLREYVYYDRWVQIQQGLLTQVVIVVK